MPGGWHILYLIPSTEFWAFAFLFTVATALFFDHKMVLITSIEITFSLGVSWLVRQDVLLPVKNELFVPNIINRVVCVLLSLLFIWFLTWIVEHFLVHAKKDEMQKNNEMVQGVLASVSELSERLGEAGNVLSNISSNESASAEEHSATSETLLSSNTELSQKSDNSMVNLNELQKWEGIADGQMEKVRNSSNELLEKSRGNEKKLQELRSINEDVAVSMGHTNTIAEKLSESVKEIDVTLNIISGISSSINLLALNASIEAARAGEAGKGFAVVATEVGNLANETKESLDQVTTVIARVQDSVSEIIKIIHISIDSINSMGDAHSQQAEVIKNTVQINEDIAERIKQENAEFSNIAEMMESNTNDIVAMTEQVGVLNQMVEQINRLLAQE